MGETSSRSASRRRWRTPPPRWSTWGPGACSASAMARTSSPPVILAKNVKRVVLMRALDNFDPSPPRPSTARPPRTRPMCPRPLLLRRSRGLLETLVLLYQTAETLARPDAHGLPRGRLTGCSSASTPPRRWCCCATTGVMVPAAVRHRGKLDKGEVPVSDAIVDEALRRAGRCWWGTCATTGASPAARASSSTGWTRCSASRSARGPLRRRALPQHLRAQRPELEALLDLCTAVAHLVATGVEKFSSAAAVTAATRAPRCAPPRALPPARGGRAPPVDASARAAGCPRSRSAGHRAVRGPGRLWCPVHPHRRGACLEMLNDFHPPGGLIFSFEGTLESSSARRCAALRRPRVQGGRRPAGGAGRARPARGLGAAHVHRPGRALRAALRPPHRQGLVGMVGPETRPAYSAVGEGVNMASWLAARPCRGRC